MRKKANRRDHWLNNKLWRLAIGEWIALTLSFIAIVVLFCLFFIRRHTVEYHFQHGFAVADPEFVGSALALANPVLICGNKIELLNNGDQYSPAMLEAIQSARQTINFEGFIFYSDDT